MSQSWRALRLRDHFDTPSKHGVAKAWSPAGKNEGWRDYADYAPELREYNTQKKALRSQERGEPQRARSRSASPDAPGRLSRSSSRARDDALSGSWRLSYRASISRRTQLQLKQQRPKRVGQLPVFSGMATFTLRYMGITHLDGLGVHPEVTKVFLQQNWLTSFDGWEHQPNLVELHASDNCIESFKGFVASTTLERIFLQGNPITRCYHYRLMAIAACGKNLRMIDNEPVRKLELDRALALGKDVADAIRHGWILDNMPNAEADVDLSLEHYLYYKKYGVLPEAARAPSMDEDRRQHSTSRGRSESPRHRSATKSPQNRQVKSRTPLRRSASQSVWQYYDDEDDDEDKSFGGDSALPRGRRDGKYSKSRSPVQRTTRVSDKTGSDMEEEGALEDPEDYDDAERASRHVKLLLNKLRAGVTLDDQLDAFMKLQRSLSGAMGGDEQERGDSAQTRRLFQDAGTLYGWRNVQEMTVKLIDEVNALEKRRRHVGAIEPRRQKNMCSVTPEPDAQEESAIETRIRAALRKSLLGTNGEPRTARGLKRAVLRQWANVVEEDQEQGRGPSEQEPDEETVRMILDLDFSEVESNIDGFSVALEKDVKNALGIDGEGIRVCSVEAGSVIAMLALLPVSDGRSAMELVDSLKAQAADPASTLRSGVYTSSVQSLTHVTKRDSSQRNRPKTAHRRTLLSQPATPVNKPSPQSVANAAVRAQECENEREEMQRLASEWQISQFSPEHAAFASPKPSGLPKTPVEDIEEEEAALMKRLAEVQEQKKKHKSPAQSSPQVTQQVTPQMMRKARAPPPSASSNVSHADAKTAAKETEQEQRLRREESVSRNAEEQETREREAAAAEAKRLEIEARMRKELETEERIKKEVEEKLRKEKQLEDQLKREVEEKVKKEFEEKMKREEMERRKKEDEEMAKRKSEDRRKLEEEEKMRREADDRRRLEEEERQRREDELKLKKDEEERRLAEERKEQERKREDEARKKRESERLEAEEKKRREAEERTRKEEDMKKRAEDEARQIESAHRAEEEKRELEEEAAVAHNSDRPEESQKDSTAEAPTQSPQAPTAEIRAAENDGAERKAEEERETRAAAEEEQKQEELRKRREEEDRKAQEERVRREAEEEERKQEELRKQREEVERKVQEERVRREAEEEERKQEELRKRREEEERKVQEERVRREAEEEERKQEELRKRREEEERERKEAEQRKQEEEQRQEEARRKQEEEKRQEEEKVAEEGKWKANAEEAVQRETDQAESRSEQRAHEVASAAASATPDGQSAHKAAELQSHRSNSPSDSTVGETPGDKEKKKKKKKPDELDAEARQVLLKKCEIRGEPTEGEKMTAFAKRAKKIEISCTFQWYRVSNGKEEVIAGADKASYVVTNQDVGHLLKVVGLPTVKETNEHGQPVSAIISQPVNPKATSGNGSNEDDATLQPRLTDWKIEMNPRQEYVDPIRMHYTYAGGVEGNSIVQWFREVDSDEIGDRGEDGFEEIIVKDTTYYQPYVDDVNKRIKLHLTPVRDDGLHGPTYQHIIDPLSLPFRLQEDVTRCTQEFKSRGANFLLAQVDLMDPNVPPRNMRVVCVDKQLKVRNADTDKTEVKVKVGRGCVRVQAHEEIQRLFSATFAPTKSNSNPITYHFLADSMRSRDIIVLTLRAIAKGDP